MSGKVLVMHNGARDHYEVALALHEAGLLETLVTNGYRHMNGGVFQSLVAALPGGARKLAGRRRPEIPDDRVASHWGMEIFSQLARRFGTTIGNHATAWQEAAMGRSAARRARAQECAAVLSYSYCAYPLFRALQGTGIRRLLFQCHPHPATARRVLRAEAERWPELAPSLLREKELSCAEGYYQQLVEEPRLADGILAASSYTRQSLVENGIDPERIRVIPYGADSFDATARATAEVDRSSEEPFRILFVGQMGQRKGLAYLFEACARMGMDDAVLVLCGRGFSLEGPLARQASLPWVEVQRDLSDAELAVQYQRADVFVLPSVLEGFGLVLLEAMAFGVPVVTTERGGGPDLIRDGENGALVPAGDPGRLAEVLSHLRRQKAVRERLATASRQTAAEFTWRRFRQGVAAAVTDLLASSPGRDEPPGKTRTNATPHSPNALFVPPNRA